MQGTAFDARDSQCGGRMSFRQFQALIAERLAPPMTKVEVRKFFQELFDCADTLAVPKVLDAPGRDVHWSANPYDSGAADTISRVRDTSDPDSSLNTRNVWLVFYFRSLLRYLVRFGEKSPAFAVDHRSPAWWWLPTVAASERVAAEWPVAGVRRGLLDLSERFLKGLHYEREIKAFSVNLWADQPQRGPASPHVDFNSCLDSGAHPSGTSVDVLGTSSADDFHSHSDNDARDTRDSEKLDKYKSSDDEPDFQGVTDIITVPDITPAPTGVGAARRARRGKAKRASLEPWSVATLVQTRCIAEVCGAEACHPLLEQIADIIVEVCGRQDAFIFQNALGIPLSVFDAPRPFNTSIHDYLIRFTKYGYCSKEVFVCMLIYLDRFGAMMTLHSRNVHRALLAAFVCAAKLRDDVYFANSHYAQVGGVSLEELNVIELCFLQVLDWNMHVHGDLFESYSAGLLRKKYGPCYAEPLPTEAALSESNGTLEERSYPSSACMEGMDDSVREAQSPDPLAESQVLADHYAEDIMF
eukprot:TRINITY_DN56033_c0_g1_i1.p1 TRINITY_DN56033_c0_g1~~TRINITY_DN56033_c0_g1_i1.p1  ORF type:complete len:563 (+),score=121.38 TRINITY_DN56033_c0_g1_i1:111-1691(+)